MGVFFLNINELIQHIEEAEINFYMIDKRKRRNHPPTYITYEPHITDIEENIRDLYLDTLNDHPLFQAEQVEFDVQRAEDEVLETCAPPNVTFFPIQNLIENSVENLDTRAPFNVRNVDIASLNSYVIKFSNDGVNPVYIIRRFSKFTALNRGVRAVVRNNSFSRINERVWGFEPLPDLILWGEEAIIVNRFGLSTLCEVDDYYLQTATELLQRFQNRIHNFDNLLQHCMEDRRTLKKLVKLAERPTVAAEVLAQEREVLQRVIDTHGLTLTFHDGGEINFRGEDGEAAEIVLLLADAYFVSSALNQPGRNH